MARDAFPLLDVVPPEVSVGRATDLLRDHWGIEGDLVPLASQQDRNLLVTAGEHHHVLRFDNPALPRRELEAQDAALVHLAARIDALAAPLAVPRPIADHAGSTIVAVDLDGVAATARLLSHVPGTPIGEAVTLTTPLLRGIGGVVAAVSTMLRDFAHPGAVRVCQWDTARTRELRAALGDDLDASLAAAVDEAIDRGVPVVDAHAATLPRQVCHGDLHPDNLLATRGDDGLVHVTGVIDLGDLVETWRVHELAVAVAGATIRAPERALGVVRAIVRGASEGDGGVAWTDEEIAVLWALVRWRIAMETIAAAHQCAIDPANDYAAEQRPRLAHALAVTARLPPRLVEEVARDAAGRPARRIDPSALPVASLAAWLPALSTVDVRVVDLSVTSATLRDDTWLDAASVARTIEREAHGPEGVRPVVLARHGEGRLTATRPPGFDEPASVHLGVDVIVAEGSAVVAPFAARVRAVTERTVVLAPADHPAVEVIVAGIAHARTVGEEVASGSPLGTLVGGASGPDRIPTHLHLQVVEAGTAAEPLVPGSLADAWLRLSPDPSPLVGVVVAAEPDDPHGLARRRDAVLARAQERYFDEPPRIERGRGAWLIDTRGRAFLDVVNNVAAVGHSHPRVTAAVASQLALLNTNSRFLYAPMVAFAERLVALLPDPLDTVFLVNSGSEAVEAALRLVRVATGRRDVVCLAGAYHGWTTATDEITTPVLGRTKAIEPWVHPLEAPYLHRGPYGPGAEGTADERAARLTAAAVAHVERLASDGHAPAALVAEAFLGNAGGVELPVGYLAAVTAAVRGVGGLVVADEVQVGYGRTGTTFWAFEAEGIVPDVVTMAKMVGNGLPVGAVVTTRAIAEAFAQHDAFFSSSGGSPVGCAAGLAVLDVIADEGLMANAAAVGAHLRVGLERLAARHPAIGALHGRGLYQGVDLVLERATMAPAPALARAVCEELLGLGVVCQPTGEWGNVLKVKPPLVITTDEVDHFLGALDRALHSLDGRRTA